MSENIEEKVITIIKSQLSGKENINDISLSTDISSDLEADSLDVVELVMALEEEFSIDISDDSVEKLKTVGDVVKHVQELAG